MPGRIAFLIHGLQVGGAEKFFVSLVNGFQLAGLNPLAIVLDLTSPLVKDLHKDAEVILLPRKFKYDFSVCQKIKKIIRINNISKIFCVEGFSFFMAKLPFWGNPKVIFFLSLHSTLPISRKRYLLDLFYLRFFQKRDRVIFICDYQRKLFSTKYYFKPEISTVIYNGINLRHYEKQATKNEIGNTVTDWKESLHISPGEKVILLVGRISIEKGHIDAIHALHIFHRKYNATTHLVFVGDGDQEILTRLKSTIAELDLSNHVHLTGPTADVRRYLYASDIFTLTSWSETFSIAALEALSMELPCSLTQVGGAEEMLAGGKLGVLSKPADPDSIAVSWNDLFQNMPDPGLIRKYTEEHYSLEKMQLNYLEYISN